MTLAFHIEDGNLDEVDLSGLGFVVVIYTPGDMTEHGLGQRFRKEHLRRPSDELGQQRQERVLCQFPMALGSSISS